MPTDVPTPPATPATRRLVITLTGVTLIALWPVAWWPWQGVAAGMLLALSLRARVPARLLVRRWAVVWLLSGLMALGLVGQRDWPLRAGNLLLKSTLSVWALSLLTHITPLAELVAALRRLGVPRVWADTIAFWSRYYAVLAEEWRRLQQARRARKLGGGRRLKFQALSRGLGVLFIRAYERAERVHQAMLARGYRPEA